MEQAKRHTLTEKQRQNLNIRSSCIEHVLLCIMRTASFGNDNCDNYWIMCYYHLQTACVTHRVSMTSPWSQPPDSLWTTANDFSDLHTDLAVLCLCRSHSHFILRLTTRIIDPKLLGEIVTVTACWSSQTHSDAISANINNKTNTQVHEKKGQGLVTRHDDRPFFSCTGWPDGWSGAGWRRI